LTRAPIEPISRVLAALRAKGYPLFTPVKAIGPISLIYREQALALATHRCGHWRSGPCGRILVRGEPGWEIIPELAPESGEIVIDKPGKGSFCATIWN